MDPECSLQQSQENEEAPPISFNMTSEETESTGENSKQNTMMPPLSKKRKDDEIQTQEGLLTSDKLFEQAQTLIAEINAKRKNDSMLLENFKKTMEMKIESLSSTLEKALFQSYESTGSLMQEKLQDLYASLDRISKLEQELEQFKNALGLLYNDVASS